MPAKRPKIKRGSQVKTLIKKPIPFAFVLDELEPLSPWTRPMFGCLAIYVGDRIVLVLRSKNGKNPDNGVWLATTEEHHASLATDFSSMRSISIFGPGPSGWQVLPEDAPDFEESVMRACRMIRTGDPRIGKVPVRKRPRRPAPRKKARGP